MGQNLISVAAQVLGLWLLSYVIDFSNGEALYFLRVGYILYVFGQREFTCRPLR